MKEQIRNTEIQINEEEIGKLPEKEFRYIWYTDIWYMIYNSIYIQVYTIMIVKIIKDLENKREEMQESINKDLEQLKNKHKQTTQLLKLKIL